MSALGHSLPIHSAPVPTNVRYAPNSDQNGGSMRTTLSAISVRELERIEVVGARTTYSLARQP